MEPTGITPFTETRPRIPFDKFRELVEEQGLPEVRPDPRHTGDGCRRCEWDMAVYGEAWWDTVTKQHLNPQTIVRRRPL